MPDRSEHLAIIVTAQNLASRALKQVSKDLGGLERAGVKAAGQAGHGVRTAVGNLERMGLLLGGVAVAAGVAAERIGIDFQDAFAGVRKTVDASDKDLTKIYDDLKALSTRIPVRFEDLAGIATEAGALGVATKDVVKFTDVVARLSAATVGLSPAAAAEAFGKLGNVLHVAGAGFEHMGSALVALGNAGASSEGDIVAVAVRFGAAGAQAKLSAAQVLGFSSAIASMGVEPEAAGSSLSRLFNNITKYIATGNVKIKSFAKVAGVSIKEFSGLYKKDAAGAVELFLQKLGKMDRFKASAALKDAGVTNVRDINAVLLLSQNYGELKRQVDLSTDAYAKNTELQAVSQKRFDTLKSTLTELVNTGRNAADSFSQGLSPAISDVAKEAKTFVLGHEADFKALGVSAGNALREAVDWGKKLDWKAIADALKGAVGFAKGLVDAFASAPPWLQQAVVTGWGLNKLTGGAVVDVGVTLTKGALGQVFGSMGGLFARGANPASPLYTKEVGLGGAGGPGAGAGGGLKGALIAGAALVAGGIAVEKYQELQAQQTAIAGQTTAIAGQVQGGLATSSNADLKTQLDALMQGYNDIQKTTGGLGPLQGIMYGGQLDMLQAQIAAVTSELNKRAGAAPDSRSESRFNAPDTSGDSHSENRSIQLAETAALKANTAALQKDAHKKAITAMGGDKAGGMHRFLMAFRTGGVALAVKNFPKEFKYLQTASEHTKLGNTYQRGIRENIAVLKRDMVGATAEQKRKLSADILALQGLLRPGTPAVVAAVNAGAAKVAAAVGDIHVLAGGAPAGDKKDWVKYPHDGLTWALGGTGMTHGRTGLPGIGVAGEAQGEGWAIIRHPRPINGAEARSMVLQATILIPPLTIDPKGATHGLYRFQATVLGKAG